MDKAIDTLEFLREYLNNEVHPNCEYYIYSSLIDITDKALAELTAHKAKNEAKERQGETEQAHRQTGSKPPQYQIGIDTFERSKANQMAETRVEIAKFMIDKYNWRNKGQDIEDFQKIKDYCDFAIEALNEIKG